MNNPYFSNEDHIAASTFLSGSCGSERIYLNGLASGDILVSRSPYVIYNSNGLLAGLDDRFTRFEVVRQGSIVKTLTLDWKTDCSSTSTQLTSLTSGVSNLPIPIVLMIVSLVYLAILRRIRR